MIRIDAHQHFWKVERGDYGWLTPESTILYKDFTPEDLMPHLKALHIDYTVLVQAAPTVEETMFLLDLYEQYDFIAGVVGWLDLEADTFENEYQKLREHEGFVGLRPMLQDIEDDRWILRPKVLRNMAFIVEDGFAVDLLVLPKHLPHIRRLLEIYPQLNAIVDHAAKPDIKRQRFHPWQEDLKEVAAFPNVMCKLSGLITEADHDQWQEKDLRPVIDHVLDLFGVNRVVFGSDWPVCLTAGTYEDVYNALYHNVHKQIDEKDLLKIFGLNAVHFYKRLKLRKDKHEKGAVG